MMTAPRQRRHPFSLNNAIELVTLAKSSSDSISIPGLSAILAVTLYILETTKQVTSNRLACRNLAVRASQIALSVDGMAKLDNTDGGDDVLNENLANFHKVLEEISAFMKSQVELKFRHRALNRRSIEASISEHASLLDDAWMTFHTASLINIQHKIHLLRSALSQTVTTDGEYRLFRKSDIHLKDIVATYDDGQGYIVEEHNGEVEGRAVMVRRSGGYSDYSKLQQYLKFAKKIWDHRVEQLCGYSRAEGSIMFTVYLGEKKPVLKYIEELSDEKCFPEILRLTLETVEAYDFMWDNGGYQNSIGLNGIRSHLIDQSGKITIGCHDIADVTKSEVRVTEVKKATRTRDYLLRPGSVPQIVESYDRQWCSPENQHNSMKLLYEKLLRMDKPHPSPHELSELMQAWSKVIVPTRVLDHVQTYEVEIGDIIYLDYVTADEYRVKRLTNVIDQLGDVLGPPAAEWQYVWHRGCPCEKVVQDGVARFTFLLSEKNYASVLFDSIRFLQPEVASIWLLENILGGLKDYHYPLDRICLVTGSGHHAVASIERPTSLGERPFLH